MPPKSKKSSSKTTSKSSGSRRLSGKSKSKVGFKIETEAKAAAVTDAGSVSAPATPVTPVTPVVEANRETPIEAESTPPTPVEESDRPLQEEKVESEAINSPPSVTITLEQLEQVLFQDADNKISESGKWPLVIDSTGKVTTFLKNTDVNYINAGNPSDMQSGNIRTCVLDAIRDGKPLVLEMMDVETFESCALKFADVQKGLPECIMDKSIIEDDNYLALVEDTDGPEYDPTKFTSTENFKFFIVTNKTPPSSLAEMTYPIHVQGAK